MPNRKTIRSSFVLAALGVTTLTPAIIIRDDRPDGRYLDLARQFTAYGDLHEAGSTLIAPRWLLTAGHVAVDTSPYNAFATVGGQTYPIDRVILHPAYFRPRLRDKKDLALVRLSRPVRGIAPVALYRSSDETGMEATFFGRGQTGNGKTGPTHSDGQMRGATNKVEEADSNYVVFRFDSPANATDLEGISGPGDSGGPALVKVKGKWAIIGVSSSNEGMGEGPCRYETKEYYARVSTARDWIERTMRSAPPSTIPWTVTAPFRSWPTTRSGEIAEALVQVVNAGDASAYEAFNQKYRDPRSLRRATPAERAKSYEELRNRVGQLNVVEYATDPKGTLMTLLRNEKGQHFQLSLYFYDEEKKAFDGFWIGSATPRPRQR